MASQTILITGASSGIGAALARVYAAARQRLVLWGRDLSRLEGIAAECRALGAEVETRRVDVADIDTMSAELRALDARMKLDIVIFNAGLGGLADEGKPAETPERIRAIAAVNFTSPVVAAAIMAEAMAARKSGHIVLVGSIAESFPLPMAPTYAATKAGLRMYADSLAMRLARFKVALTLVSPGFIDTPMSQGIKDKKPFLMSAERAAHIIVRQIGERRARIVVPWQFAVLRGLSRLIPSGVMRLALTNREK